MFRLRFPISAGNAEKRTPPAANDRPTTAHDTPSLPDGNRTGQATNHPAGPPLGASAHHPPVQQDWSARRTLLLVWDRPLVWDRLSSRSPAGLFPVRSSDVQSLPLAPSARVTSSAPIVQGRGVGGGMSASTVSAPICIGAPPVAMHSPAPFATKPRRDPVAPGQPGDVRLPRRLARAGRTHAHVGPTTPPPPVTSRPAPRPSSRPSAFPPTAE